jgi:hypothetical protein
MSALQDFKQHTQLELSDCPVVPPEGLCQLPPHPDGRPLSLADLQGDAWWTCLPGELRDCWRRQASTSRCLFTPTADDLKVVPVNSLESSRSAAGSGGGVDATSRRQVLARVLFWARWLLGEPVIVRGTQVSPDMWRETDRATVIATSRCAMKAACLQRAAVGAELLVACCSLAMCLKLLAIY